ncbi:ThiF family adenylyltransferase [Marininema halotolerans]|uniref:Adenylyltransferase and sulfurtransferase n=1 Tax=Marininema halotolerans TaxID=1155944 RepID=A0A1I6TKR2_9BACL|nr:ThiF family adenylyltransferase [Marininema halotolerans]SFS89842.1 adenylyltransferase and sulfurtransferase [Marininema halotolerans]
MQVDHERFSRQILFKPIGETGQERLANSRVAIVGLGALGSALAHHMARAGVGFLRLIDRDFVEKSNLQRQMLYDEKDATAELPKAIATAEKLRAIDTNLQLEPIVTDVTWRNAESLLTDVDLILDGSDNFHLRYLINDVSLKYHIPWIYGGAVSSHGMNYTILPGTTPCIRCLFPEPPGAGTTQTCDTAGVIGPIVQIVAARQGVEAIKWLVGDHDALDLKLRHTDLWKNEELSMDVTLQRKPDCPACSEGLYEFLQPENEEETTLSLCGRNTVQITHSPPQNLDLEKMEQRLAPIAKVQRNRFLLRAQVDENHRLILFPDGRVLVQGTSDPSLARSIATRYLGG